jgi:fatty-acyl-CoA synthase
MGASDSMPKDLLEEVLKRCPASSPQLYGLSEGGIITYLKPDESMKKIGSSGKPHSQCEVRLVDENDQDVPLGSVGEIICRGEHIMSHYWDMPEETKNALRGGWLHTGDLGRFDDEGYIYIVGRKKDMIISGGQNIYPAEVEKLLLQHAKIEEAAVIGIPDKEWGESVIAVVAPKKGQKLTEDEVIHYVKENLASYNKPRSVRFMDALPRTSATGKLQKAELRKQISEEINRKK